MNRIRVKLNKFSSGFSLAETLVALLIVLMVSSILVAGLPAAFQAYSKVVDGANAQVLLSTGATRIRDELGFATDVYLRSDNTVNGYSQNGFYKQMTNKADSGIIINMKPSMDSTVSPSEVYLIPPKASTDSLVLSFGTITYNKEKSIFTVAGLEVKKGDNTLADLDKLIIRAVASPRVTDVPGGNP